MKFDKTTVIRDLKGEPIVERNRDGAPIDPKEPEMTFGKLVIAALSSDVPNPDNGQPYKPHQKYKHYKLAERIEKADKLFEVDSEEAHLIRQLVGMFPPVYVGRCYEILDEPITQPAAPGGRSPRPRAPAQP